MKLLIGGKIRNIYNNKNGSVYYKSGGEKVDVSYMFKKNGGDLKKKYSESVKETPTKVKESHRIKNNKKFYGGNPINLTFQAIEFDSNHTTDKRKELLKLLQIAYNVVLERRIHKDTDYNDGIVNATHYEFLIVILFALRYDLLTNSDKLKKKYANLTNEPYYTKITKNFQKHGASYNDIVFILNELQKLTTKLVKLDDPSISRMFDNIESIISLHTTSVTADLGYASPVEEAEPTPPTPGLNDKGLTKKENKKKGLNKITSPAQTIQPTPPGPQSTPIMQPTPAPTPAPAPVEEASPAATAAPPPPVAESENKEGLFKKEIDYLQQLLDDISGSLSEMNKQGGNVPPPVVPPPVVQPPVVPPPVVPPPVVPPPVVPPRLIHKIQQQLINTQKAINKIKKVITKIKQIKDKIKDWSTTKSSEEIRQNRKKLIEVEKQIQEKVIIAKQTVDNIINFVLTIQQQIQNKTKFEIQINEVNKLLSILEELKTILEELK